MGLRLCWLLSGSWVWAHNETYQYLTRPEIVAVDKHVAPMEPGPVYLTLVDLPEDALLFAQFGCAQTFTLPVFPVPIFVCFQICGVCDLDASEVHPRIILGVAVGENVGSSSQSADVAIPGLGGAVPPVFAEALDFDSRSWRGSGGDGGRVECDCGDTGAEKIILEIWPMVEEKEENP